MAFSGFNQAITLTGTGTSSNVVTPPRSIRERLTNVRETLHRTGSLVMQMQGALDGMQPPATTDPTPTGPLAVEALVNELELLSDAIAQSLDAIATKLG